MSAWVDRQGYDRATIGGEALVLVRGGDYWSDPNDVPWRRIATAVDGDEASRIVKALNVQLHGDEEQQAEIEALRTAVYELHHALVLGIDGGGGFDPDPAPIEDYITDPAAREAVRGRGVEVTRVSDEKPHAPVLVCPPGGKVHVAWPRLFWPGERRTDCGKAVASDWIDVLPGPVAPSRACESAACALALRTYMKPRTPEVQA